MQQYDQFSVVLLERSLTAPKLDAKTSRSIRDEHLNRIAQLHESGQLLAAGPTVTGSDETLEAFGILTVDRHRAEQIFWQDPLVKAGIWKFKIVSWTVPKGAINYAHVSFPKSLQEAGM